MVLYFLLYIDPEIYLLKRVSESDWKLYDEIYEKLSTLRLSETDLYLN
jgi:hypothetical protein